MFLTDISHIYSTNNFRLTSTFHYPEIKPLDEEICFQYKQSDIDITVNNKGVFHGAISVGTNTDDKQFMPRKSATPRVSTKRLTFQDTKVIELSEKNYEEDNESSDEELLVEEEEYVFDPEIEKNDSSVERRVFLLPSCVFESNSKYGFELFANDHFSKLDNENQRDLVKIGNDFIDMKRIHNMSEFGVRRANDSPGIFRKLDCKRFNIIENLKNEWNGSFWTQRFV